MSDRSPSDRLAPAGPHHTGVFESALRLAASGLDVLIVVYATALAALTLTGGVNLGVVSIRGAAKPLFVFFLLVPVRVALGSRSWLSVLVQAPIRHATLAWRLARARTPDAVFDVAFAIAVVRLASLSAGFLANLVLEPARPRGFQLPFTNNRFAEIFVAWDSGWYWDIATRGYYFSTDGQSSIAFFPLYPMLMRAFAAPFGGGAGATWVAGIAVSMSAYALALVALHRLTERICGSREVARRTVLYVAVFPWSLFLGRVYAESAFLLTSVLAVSRAHEGRWLGAGGWGALATLARPNGILIGLPLAIMALHGRPGARDVASRWLSLTPIPAAMLGYCAYVYTLTGDPLGWISAQVHWGYSLGHPPWQQLLRMAGTFVELGPYDYFFSSDIAVFELLHGVTAFIFLVLTPSIFRRLGPALGAYVLVSLLVPLSSNTLEGLGRYASVLFPAFMFMGSLSSARLHEAIIMTSLVFRTLLVCFFVTWQSIY
jgi:hypothetical protein